MVHHPVLIQIERETNVKTAMNLENMLVLSQQNSSYC